MDPGSRVARPGWDQRTQGPMFSFCSWLNPVSSGMNQASWTRWVSRPRGLALRPSPFALRPSTTRSLPSAPL